MQGRVPGGAVSWQRPDAVITCGADRSVHLTCGHTALTPRWRRDGRPAKLQWCRACHIEGRPARPSQERIAVEMTVDDARWLAAILSAGLAHDDYKWRHQASRVLKQTRAA